MKTCDDIMDLVTDYLDENVDNETKKQINQHLKECEACNAIYQDLLSITNQLNATQEEELPSGFGETLHNKLIMEEQKKRLPTQSKVLTFFKSSNFRAVSSVAAVLIFLFFAKNLFIRESNSITDHSVPPVSKTPGIETTLGSSNQIKPTPDPEKSQDNSVKPTITNTKTMEPTRGASEQTPVPSNQQTTVMSPYMLQKSWDTVSYQRLDAEVLNNSANITKISMLVKTTDNKSETVKIKSMAQTFKGVEVSNGVSTASSVTNGIVFKFLNSDYSLFINEFNKVYGSQVSKVDVVLKATFLKQIQENELAISKFDTQTFKVIQPLPTNTPAVTRQPLVTNQIKIIQNFQINRQLLIEQKEIIQKEMQYTYVTISF